MNANADQKKQVAEELILELLTYRKSLILAGRSTESHEQQLKDLITTLLWKHTEAHGKYDGCLYWSKQALLSRKKHGKVVTKKREDPEGALRHEHLFPRKQSIEKLFALDSPNMTMVQEILSVNIGVVVTVQEDHQLARDGVFEDPWKRYRDAGIEWEKVVG
ncbi:MAG: hypothetical protein HZB32_03590 [Nitrospirae bacterium]|nr:hypothetical protein [Nitrospirota bacterium]